MTSKARIICPMLALLASAVFFLPLRGQEAGDKSCIGCHEQESPGIVSQWRASKHGEEGVECIFCHQAEPEDADAFEHYGETIAVIVSPKDCANCHEKEYREQKK